MTDIQVKFIGENPDKVQQELRTLVEKYIGPDVMQKGAGAASTTKTLIALTLSIAIPVLFASPRGFFQHLAQHSRQAEFLKALQKFTTDYNIELVIPLPDGRRVDVRTTPIDELIDILSQHFKN